MPYIRRDIRERIDPAIAALLPLVKDASFKPGNLNYAITKLCVGYLGKDAKYFNYNEVIGVLECLKQELYRRVVAPYEDGKVVENGDVY